MDAVTCKKKKIFCVSWHYILKSFEEKERGRRRDHL